MRELVDKLSAATERLSASIRDRVDLQALHEPSLLPGWTRAHVLVHLARNADGLRNLLLAARSGSVIKMYASPTTRVADIEAGVTRPYDVSVADALEASGRFLIETLAMPADAWAAQVQFTSGTPNAQLISAERIMEMRLEEVEVHHVDLGVGYGFADTPRDVADRLIDIFAARRSRQGVPLRLDLSDTGRSIASSEVPETRTIRGASSSVLGWLAGRTTSGLHVEGDDVALPDLPPLA